MPGVHDEFDLQPSFFSPAEVLPAMALLSSGLFKLVNRFEIKTNRIKTNMNKLIEKIIDEIFDDFLKQAKEDHKPKIVEIKTRKQDVLLVDFINGRTEDPNWLPKITKTDGIEPRHKYEGRRTEGDFEWPYLRPLTNEEQKILTNYHKEFELTEDPDYPEYYEEIRRCKARNAPWYDYPPVLLDTQTEAEKKFEEFCNENPGLGHLNKDEWFSMWEHALSPYGLETWY